MKDKRREKTMFDLCHYYSVRESRIQNHLPIARVKFSDEAQDIIDLVNREVVIGDKVIVVGNEPEPPSIGIYKGFFRNDYGPRIVEHLDGREFVSFGAMSKYSDELWDKLKPFEPIEVFNLLSSPRNVVIEKYGVKYRHFREVYVTTDYDINDESLVYEFSGKLISTCA